MQLGVAAAEDLSEGLAEIAVELGKLRGENLLHTDGQLVDDALQFPLGGLEVGLLLPKEGEAFGQLLKFLDRVQIDVAQRAHLLLERGRAAAGGCRVGQRDAHRLRGRRR